MLILDVRTRWSSTHQMLRIAIDSFVYHNRELRNLELSDADWSAIEMVTEWLKAFRAATTEMSRTKRPMLSTTHAIFRGLQDHLRHILRNLPNAAPTRLKRGLFEAHRKLSDYSHADALTAAPPLLPQVSSSRRTSPQKPNFTKRYQQDKRLISDEFDTFFKLPPQDFETCDPIQW
ncbi:hypothetical protein B0H10DRAFT_2343269 [Mycena sp. CBHHK59/15]|nr:hypothetical protein B0H10DRAFT_2343269 [Mycena sp. CBHHK59/15]